MMESDRPREGSQNQDASRYTRDPTKSAPRIPPGFESKQANIYWRGNKVDKMLETEAARRVMDQPPMPVRPYGGNPDEQYMGMGSAQNRPHTGVSQGDCSK